MLTGSKVGYFAILFDEKGYYNLSFVGGEGSKDNDKFELANNTLTTKVIFNYEIQVLYSIRLRIKSSNGLTKEKVYVVRI